MRLHRKKAGPEGSMTVLHPDNVTAELSRDPPVAKINIGRPTSFLPLPKDPRDTHIPAGTLPQQIFKLTSLKVLDPTGLYIEG